jgi:thioester reductase-like protein
VLPAPEQDAYASRAYESPRGEVEEILAGIWQSVLRVQRVGRNDNFFELGGHSLLVLTVLFKINRAFEAELRVADVYQSPTISQMAQRVLVGPQDDELVDLEREAQLPEDIVAKPGALGAPPEAVLLTGATGFVGRFVLAQLLEDTNATVYCLVRAKSRDQAAARLRSELEKWELWRDEWEGRIVSIAGDLRLQRLGLDESTYRMLCQRIDSIYHCGASMNHLETYTMAKPANVNAAKDLVRLATEHRPKLINYISTLGVFNPVSSKAERVVSELTSIDHERHFHAQGYAASKWVSERIFLIAAERGVACNIFRLGVVWADSQLGRYDELQREYRILKSCLLSGYGIRDYRYDPAPPAVDYAARALVFLATKHSSGGGIFHISTSRPVSEGVFEQCNQVAGVSLELVPLFEWIGEIKRLHEQGCSLPVVPLIEFAFSMDEHSFAKYQGDSRLTSVRADWAQTRRELDEAGIIAPLDLNVSACIESVRSRDSEVSESHSAEILNAPAAHSWGGALRRR